MVVTPPAAAAFVADAKPSQRVRLARDRGVNRRGHFAVRDQQRAESRQLRQGRAQVVLPDVPELRDARIDEEALEADDAGRVERAQLR